MFPAMTLAIHYVSGKVAGGFRHGGPERNGYIWGTDATVDLFPVPPRRLCGEALTG